MIFLHKPYIYIPYEEFTRADLPEAHRAYKSHYLDLDCAFDIETSSDQDNKLSWMYMWQFAINDITIIGRTWEEFQEFLDILTGLEIQREHLHYPFFGRDFLLPLCCFFFISKI